MIEGGWNFVWPAYGLALGAIAMLTALVLARLRAWARKAQDLDTSK